ncbi:aminopeptidase N [Glaciecola sp. SC05]|uniref:aminopeptidase N n=1 Tax=Glaciecola sp. SC05 TaxID=1987355 RepID=UPI003528A6B9
MSTTMTAKRREDYQPSNYSIDSVELSFELSPQKTRVKSRLKVTRNDSAATKIDLDGIALEFISLHINGEKALAERDFTLTDSGISIVLDIDSAIVEIENSISPENNTSLEGLYYVSKAFCTQCEAQGFRKITYFLDRPDVLSIYTVTIISDDPSLSYLLSNGNKIEDSILEDGRRKVVWHDPHYKPCYLFALVAGHFDLLEDRFISSEGREIALQVFVDEGRLNQAEHAMTSLKKAMRWDEETFDLAYDLDIYMIVAVDFFNMGAMENKGLNVFNSKFVLAEPNTATDEDYFNIESIIAHEYFHNWTGNRVTCRDWFQLSLKEGLTVFRDQKFSADMSSELSCRIKQVKVMREHQFAEDASPMSHPIRPEEVLEMNNFYTVTVYDKGAEVIRMMHTLLTPAGFGRGMKLYFERHDGQAVTCDDFVQAMQDANDVDLGHFKRWYSQSGTPVVKVEKGDDGVLNFSQENAATADQTEKHPLYIPIKLSLLDSQGHESLADEQQSGTFVLDDRTAQIKLKQSLISAVPVLLADFSAPVKIEYQYKMDDLLHIMRFAESHYAKWDASQMLYSRLINMAYIGDPDAAVASQAVLKKLLDVVTELKLPDDVSAQLLSLPSFETLSVSYQDLAPLRLLNAQEGLYEQLAQTLGLWCKRVLSEQIKPIYAYEQSQVKMRALKAVCLKLHARYCFLNKQETGLAAVYLNADNMTDKLAVLKAAQQSDVAVFDNLMQQFEDEFGHDAVVMDKWFALHATASRADILARLDLLQAHGQYSIKNPNKVRSLIGSFAFYNTQGFHAEDGSGYRFVINYLAELDKLNPQVAARIITPLLQIHRYNDKHRSMMVTQLNRLFTQKELSRDLFEKLSKTLG